MEYERAARRPPPDAFTHLLTEPLVGHLPLLRVGGLHAIPLHSSPRHCKDYPATAKHSQSSSIQVEHFRDWSPCTDEGMCQSRPGGFMLAMQLSLRLVQRGDHGSPQPTASAFRK